MADLLSFFRDATWFNARRARDYPRLLGLSYLAVFAAGYWVLVLHGSGSDFAAFWAAGRLAWRDPLLAWDFHAVAALESWFPAGRWVPFVNPPPFLLIVAPFGLLPFWAAHLAWVAVTLGLYLAATRGLVRRQTALVFAPVLLNAIGGQNGLLTAALLIGAVRLLDRRPFAAGLLIGMLVIKPHLALLTPFALLAAGRWRAVAGAAAGGLTLLAASYLLFGAEAFDAALAATRLSRAVLLSGLHALKMPTIFSLAMALGAGPLAAGLAQAAGALLAIALVLRAWRDPRQDMIGKGAVLAAALPLATPYLYGYDLPVLILPIAWLIRRGAQAGFLPWERLAIGVAFMAPLFLEPLAHAILPCNIGLLAIAGLLAAVMRRWTVEAGDPLRRPESAVPTPTVAEAGPLESPA